MREFQVQQVQLAYGYAWVIFDIVLSMAGILLLRVAIRGFNRPGLPAVTLIVCGLVPWSMFGSMYSIPEQSIQRNKRLLELPGITPLDLVFAGSLRILCTYSVMYAIFVTMACSYDGVGVPRNLIGVILLFFVCWLMGLSLGFVLMAMGRIYPPAPKFTSFFLRFSTIASGVILLLTYIPATIWPYLTWNPMLHVEELLHTYWLPAYVTPVGSPYYVVECLICLVTLGFLLERYMRHHLPQ